MKLFARILLLSLTAGACILPIVRADDPAPGDNPPPPEHHEKGRHFKERGDRIFKELGLTAEQQTQMKAMEEEQKTAADTIRADTALTPDQKREKVMQLRNDYKAKRQALLTPEQKKKAEELKAKFKERRHPHDEEAGAETK